MTNEQIIIGISADDLSYRRVYYPSENTIMAANIDILKRLNVIIIKNIEEAVG